MKTHKTCAKCGVEKPISDFSKRTDRKEGVRSWCKSCVASYGRDRYAGSQEVRDHDSERHAESNRLNPRVSYRDAFSVNGSIVTGLKKCPRCGFTKTIDEFWLSVTRASGLQGVCKSCQALYYNEWSSRNPGVVRRYKANRRVRIIGNGGYHTLEEWDDLCAYYGYKCLSCGRSDVPMTEDHIVPVSRGGTDYIDNIQPLCKPCNSRKKDKTADYRVSVF
jgi:HNH endonuclease